MTKLMKQDGAVAASQQKAVAVVATRADSMAAAAAVRFADIVGKQDPVALRNEVRELTTAVTAGDMREPERMLMGQAIALQAIFANLANRAAVSVGDKPVTTERYMRLALKAQSQCRATLETLATLKNPTLVIAQQANVTTGPQQVNNGVAADSVAQKKETAQSKLLETEDGQWLDTGATGAAVQADPAMAAMGAGDGTAL